MHPDGANGFPPPPTVSTTIVSTYDEFGSTAACLLRFRMKSVLTGHVGVVRLRGRLELVVGPTVVVAVRFDVVVASSVRVALVLVDPVVRPVVAGAEVRHDGDEHQLGTELKIIGD